MFSVSGQLASRQKEYVAESGREKAVAGTMAMRKLEKRSRGER